MSPLRYKVVTQDGRSTREPTDEELPIIQAFVGRFVQSTGTEPLGVHDVEGLETAVWFQTVHQ